MTVLTPARPAVKVTWYALLSLLLIGGCGAVIYRLFHGLTTTYLSTAMPWGAWAAFYIYFIGISAGAFLISSLVYVFGMTRFEQIGRLAILVALVAMLVGLIFIALDLGRVERMLTPLIRFNWLSPLAWEIRFYAIYIILLAAELYLSVRADLASMARRSKLARILALGSTATDQRQDRAWLRLLGIIGIPLAIIGVHGGTGTIFAIVKARGLWFSSLLPVVFIVSALVSGAGLLICFYVARQVARRLPIDPGLLRDLGKLLLGFVLVDAGLLFYEFVVPGLAMSPHDTEIIGVMTSGPFSWTFWFIQLGLGIFVPMVILLSSLKSSWHWVTVAALSVVVGVAGTRFNIVIPPLVAPAMEGLPAGYYHPSLVEWASSAGIIALGLMLFSLLAEVLPLDGERRCDA